LIEDSAAHGLRAVSFSGGEPRFDAQCQRILGTLVKLALPDRA
jgi:hypothetical protein